MAVDEDIYLITADLGYGMFDKIRERFPDRFYNVGAAEQLMMLTAVGLSLAGKKPITYTITPFYWRCAEMIRNYVSHEQVPVLIVGSGRGVDYAHDGFSHDATDDLELFSNLNIKYWYPYQPKAVETIFSEYTWAAPLYLNLKR